MDGDTLYAWQEQEDSGSWGIIAALMPGSGLVSPMVIRSLPVAHALQPLAEAHGEASGHPIRLGRFTLDGIEP